MNAAAVIDDAIPSADDAPELSVVMPCLNEERTLPACIAKAQKAMRENGIRGEVVIADNGSTDRSVAVAEELGARVVHATQRGYGNALRKGFSEARGRYIIMGDADDSYDFGEIPKFVNRLREGYSLVQGCRLPSAGGQILPGAMPWLHRWVGNPFLSFLARRMFHVPCHDIYCGMRGFSRQMYHRLNLRCTGMEFATEMMIKASLCNETVSEVPITLHPDGRQRRPHLNTFRDGWRTLRFYFLYCPRWLFFYPGFLLILLGLLGYGLALPGASISRATLGAHTLLVASLAIMLGNQALFFALFSTTFAATEGLLPPPTWLKRFMQVANLEKGLLVGAGAFLAGLILLMVAVNQWREVDFGPLEYGHTMRWVIPGVTLCAVGFQTILGSFVVSMLILARRPLGPAASLGEAVPFAEGGAPWPQ